MNCKIGAGGGDAIIIYREFYRPIFDFNGDLIGSKFLECLNRVAEKKLLILFIFIETLCMKSWAKILKTFSHETSLVFHQLSLIKKALNNNKLMKISSFKLNNRTTSPTQQHVIRCWNLTTQYKMRIELVHMFHPLLRRRRWRQYLDVWMCFQSKTSRRVVFVP